MTDPGGGTAGGGSTTSAVTDASTVLSEGVPPQVVALNRKVLSPQQAGVTVWLPLGPEAEKPSDATAASGEASHDSARDWPAWSVGTPLKDKRGASQTLMSTLFLRLAAFA
ncbi:MAG: hypothetical protein HY554_01190 [Elusimicrobia bacterium]|nr:hypothetical protein [Elusimicrobiota bacterium]